MPRNGDISQNRYIDIIKWVFKRNVQDGSREVSFPRAQLVEAARDLGLEAPKNLGDVVYSIRYRTDMPAEIDNLAPPGMTWALFPAGRSIYAFRPVAVNQIEPRSGLTKIKVPDSTPGLISRYSMSDEQALLAKVRYNRLLDIFTGMACYSLQNHYRTSIEVEGSTGAQSLRAQVETDELYVGIDRHGSHHILPVQAKGGTDRLSIIQIWQDFRVAKQKFETLTARPIATQFLDDMSIVLFEFSESGDQISIARERHYSL
ncbi:MAG: endonuclease, partial [Gemmatimonadota bacterium]|nr:endonuclease [Gemmatimonadota bacterium]